ncbi:glycosyltransferase family 4 protein [Maricurvus nonylphenolicus]|uniref:glycosyltransferase n=1 Tax=Maricurvus nonylphenolicus TaxID=1008307 RepID=UPI0036F22209
MNVLVIGYVWPEPASSAAGYRMLALLDTFIEQGWQVTFASPAEKSVHRIDLPARGIREESIQLNNSSFDAFVQSVNPDLVMFDRFMMEEQFGWRVAKYCPDALRILDTEDLFSLRYARHEHFKKTGEINPPVTPELLFTENAQREIASIYRSDLTLMISEAEMQILEKLFNVDSSLLLYNPFMLPVISSEKQTQLPAFAERQHFICIGNFRHAPNWDAVRYLKESIWPGIRKQLPDAELHIYGAYPPKKATQLHNDKQGFLVKGWAEDAYEVMRHARVNLAPLRFGAGLKGKLVDAMACGTPSVTTSIGAEGMGSEEAWQPQCFDHAEAFIDAAVRHYTHNEQWASAREKGFELHNQLFNLTQHQQQLVDRIKGLRENFKQHRLNNFTGAMLNHHHHKSTQYMAQWIEAKNRNQ